MVLRLDRLLRRVIELEWIIELAERTGVGIVTADGALDLSSPSGVLMARFFATFARF